MYFIVSLLSPERFGWLAARIVMLGFACIVYIYSMLIIPLWPFLVIALLVASVVCSVRRSHAMNFLRCRFILLGSLVSPIGAACVLLGAAAVSLGVVVLLFSTQVVSPLYGLVLVVFLSLAFLYLRKRQWRNEILRDFIFVITPFLLLAFADVSLCWNSKAVKILSVAICVLLVWRINLGSKPKGLLYRFNGLLLAACALVLFNGLAGLGAGWEHRSLEEVTSRPGVALLTKPAKHYSCLPAPGGDTLFATNGDDRNVARIPLTGGKFATRSTEGRPNWMDFIPSSNRLVTINGDGFGKSIDVLLFDASNLKKLRTARINHSLYGVYYSKKHDLIYVHTLFGTPYLIALDPKTLNIVRRRRLPYSMNFLFRLRGDDELDRLYLPDFSYNGTLYAADMKTLRTVGGVRLGTSLTDIAVAPEQDRLYIAAPLVSKIIMLRRSNLKKIGEIKAGMRVRAVAVDQRRSRLYAGNSRDGTLDVFDTDTGEKLRAIPTAKEIRSIEIGENGDVVYLASGSGVFRVDLKESRKPGTFKKYRPKINVRELIDKKKKRILHREKKKQRES